MPGGFVKPLSSRSRVEIGRLWPALLVDRVESDWAEYQVRVQAPPANPADVREKLEKIVQLSTELRVCIETLPEEGQDHLWDFLWNVRRHDLLTALPTHLTALQRAAMCGYNAELGRDGRRLRGAKHQLFYSLRHTLRQSGQPKQRINGQVAKLAEILFDDAGLERPKDLARAVREAFESGDDRSLDGQ